MDVGTGGRQARLAAWSTALRQGRCVLGAALDAVVGADAVHEVDGLPGEHHPVPLGRFLDRLPQLGVTALRYLPAAAGDVSALPGPAEFNARAVAVGGAVVCLDGAGFGLLPLLEVHGPPDDRVCSVRWVVEAVQPRLLPPVDLRQARRLLADAVSASLDQLHRLDVARHRPEADDLSAGWTRTPPSASLPPGCPVEAAELLDRAAHLHDVVALGLTEDGGAVSGWESDQRRQALVTLDRTLRHVLADAWNSGLQPVRAPAPGSVEPR